MSTIAKAYVVSLRRRAAGYRPNHGAGANHHQQGQKHKQGRRKKELDRLRAAEYRARVKQLKRLAKQTPMLAGDLEQLVAAGKGLDK